MRGVLETRRAESQGARLWATAGGTPRSCLSETGWRMIVHVPPDRVAPWALARGADSCTVEQVMEVDGVRPERPNSAQHTFGHLWRTRTIGEAVDADTSSK